MSVSPSALIAPDSVIAPDCIIEEFCVVGYGNDGAGNDYRPVRIGLGSRLRQFAVLYWGTEVGKRFHAGHKANIREACTFGDDVSIGTMTVVEHHVTIGSNVRIHSQSLIAEHTIMEDDIFIGPHVVFTNTKYPFSREAKTSLVAPHIHSGVILGGNATILPGVHVGPRSIVGAGAVVTRDVPEGVVVAGSPARIINEVADLPYD